MSRTRIESLIGSLGKIEEAQDQDGGKVFFHVHYKRIRFLCNPFSFSKTSISTVSPQAVVVAQGMARQNQFQVQQRDPRNIKTGVRQKQTPDGIHRQLTKPRLCLIGSKAKMSDSGGSRRQSVIESNTLCKTHHRNVQYIAHCAKTMESERPAGISAIFLRELCPRANVPGQKPLLVAAREERRGMQMLLVNQTGRVQSYWTCRSRAGNRFSRVLQHGWQGHLLLDMVNSEAFSLNTAIVSDSHILHVTSVRNLMRIGSVHQKKSGEEDEREGRG